VTRYRRYYDETLEDLLQLLKFNVKRYRPGTICPSLTPVMNLVLSIRRDAINACKQAISAKTSDAEARREAALKLDAEVQDLALQLGQLEDEYRSLYQRATDEGDSDPDSTA